MYPYSICGMRSSSRTGIVAFDHQWELRCLAGTRLARMRSVSDIFWSLHSGLPRQAPGSDRTTRAMLDVLGTSAGQRAVDVGCGPGRSALVLAAAGLDVLAVDTHQPFLDELEVAARAAGLACRVHPRNVPMQALPVDAGVLDVVWSEGAAYLMGFGEALMSWSRLLRPGGGMGLTECCWLTDRPSPETAEFWRQAYPSMRTVPQTLELIEAWGLQVLAGALRAAPAAVRAPAAGAARRRPDPRNAAGVGPARGAPGRLRLGRVRAGARADACWTAWCSARTI